MLNSMYFLLLGPSCLLPTVPKRHLALSYFTKKDSNSGHFRYQMFTAETNSAQTFCETPRVLHFGGA